MKCVLTGGRSAMEQPKSPRLSPSRSEVIDFSGKTDLPPSRLVRKARLLVTVDSAPMHFAAAWTPRWFCSVPPTFHWHPRSESARSSGGFGAGDRIDPGKRLCR